MSILQIVVDYINNNKIDFAHKYVMNDVFVSAKQQNTKPIKENKKKNHDSNVRFHFAFRR